MAMNDVNLKQYFDRIGFAGTPDVGWDTLVHIQQNHIAAIPFENLNPLMRIPVELDSEAIFEKIVRKHRGGYCFEHNLLLQDVLERIGFTVRGLLGRAGQEPESVGRTHMVLLVTLEGRDYLVDVGYGGLVPTGPLLLEPDIIQATPNEDYRIISPDGEYRLEIKLNGHWKRLYEFNLRKQIIQDFQVANWYTSTSPECIFTHTLVAARSEQGARYTLKDYELSIYQPDREIERRTLTSVDDVKAVLETIFYIDMSGLPKLEKYLRNA